MKNEKTPEVLEGMQIITAMLKNTPNDKKELIEHTIVLLVDVMRSYRGDITAAEFLEALSDYVRNNPPIIKNSFIDVEF